MTASKKSSKTSGLDMPMAPSKMPTMLHLDMDEVKGLGDAEVGDALTLTVKVKLVGMFKHSKEPNRLDFEVREATVADRR